jgi:hypothetical protein
MTIEITHTRRDGTRADGTRKDDGAGKILWRAGFRFDREERVWCVPGTVNTMSRPFLLKETARMLTEAGFDVEVTVDDVTPGRPVAEVEAELAERVDDRTDRYSGYAGNAAARSEAHRRRSDEMASYIPMGQPVMSRRDAKYREKIRGASERSYREYQKSAYWEERTAAAGRRLEKRNSIHTTLGRLDELTKRRAKALERLENAEGERKKAWQAELDHVDEAIGYWRQHAEATAEKKGLKVWGPGDFKPGDFVQLNTGDWFEVVRVNAKSLSIPFMVMGVNLGVYTMAHEKARGGEVFIDRIEYRKVNGRATEAELREKYPHRFPAPAGDDDAGDEQLAISL